MHIRLLRIILPTAGMSILLLLVGGVAASYLHGLQRTSSQLLIASIPKVEVAEELEVIAHQSRYQLAQYQSTDNVENLAAAGKLHGMANEWLAKAAALADSDPPAERIREMELIETIRRGYQRLFQTFEAISRDKPTAEQQTALLDQVRSVADKEILQPSQQLRQLTRRAMSEASQRNQALADRMGMGLLLLGCCGGVAGLLAGYGIARGIHRSLAQLTVPVRDATGRLNEVVGPLTVSSGESFEDLEFSLQAMADRIGEVVRQLQESQRAASRAQQLAAMGQLAAGLAHELRNPLTSMKMLVQPDDDDRETVSLDSQDMMILREEIGRLERAIQVFLDYARPPALEKRPLVLRQLVTQTVEFMAPRARQLGVEIESSLPDEAVEIEADSGQIRQVLLNLILNALDVSSQGDTISVRLFCEPRVDRGCVRDPAADNASIQLEVADRGPGLPANLGERIFEPFVSTKETGTGLGLPICKRIVEEHGGVLLAEDREGGGAVFIVRLPAPASPARL